MGNFYYSWAKAKLEREGIEEHTDELIRETLGPLLYLIRFPSMTPKEFGQEEKVSVLLKDEIIQLYRQICCGEYVPISIPLPLLSIDSIFSTIPYF